MSDWSRISTPFLLHWAERCYETISAAEAEAATKKKPTAGNLACIDIQGRQLAAIRRELDRRASA